MRSINVDVGAWGAVSCCVICHLEEKVNVCCARYPMDGGQSLLETAESRRLRACPHLDGAGRCVIYEKRPSCCRAFFCFRAAPRLAGDLADLEWVAGLIRSGNIGGGE